MTKPIIYLITEGKSSDENFAGRKTEILEKIRYAVSLKVSLIQIREKNLSAGKLFELASEAAKITKNSATKLLINDRADVALAADADGVHLTENSISVEIVRRCFPKKIIIGVSVHSLEKAGEVKKQSADFVVFGPLFASPGKGSLQGLETLRKVCEKLESFPIIALGGIDETNYAAALKSGAAGFAAIRFLNNPGNLQKIMSEIR